MPGIGAKIEHPTHGEGVVFGTDGEFWRIYFHEVGEKSIGKDYDQLTVIEPAEDLSQPDVSDIMTAMENNTELLYVTDNHHDRWTRGLDDYTDSKRPTTSSKSDVPTPAAKDQAYLEPYSQEKHRASRRH